MTDIVARTTAILSVLLAAGSLYLSYNAWQRSGENVSIEFAETDFRISADRSGVTWQGTVDLYNLSTERTTIMDAHMTASSSYSGSGPSTEKYRLGWCERFEHSPTVIEPRTSFALQFRCEIKGGAKALQFLDENKEAYPEASSAWFFLSGLYKERRIDLFDNELLIGLTGTTIRISEDRNSDLQYGTTVWVPFRVWIRTRSGSYFEQQYYVFLGASQYR